MIHFTIILAGLLTLVVFWRNFKNKRRNILMSKIPGPPTHPIIGNLLELLKPTEEIIPHSFQRSKEYGPILRLWAVYRPIVIVSGAEYVETILSSNKEIKKSIGYRLIHDWLGEGLLTSGGSRWSKHRKMITPAFHFQILDTFIPIYEINSTVLVDKIQQKILEVGNNQTFDVYPFITRCALDIICETAMGINIHAQDDVSSDYIQAVYKISKLLVHRINRVYLHSDFVYNLTSYGKEYHKCVKALHGFTENVIRKRKLIREQEGNKEKQIENEDGIKRRKAFLDLLLDSNCDLTDTDLREEVDTFMFEGHDTTTAGISWAIYLLGRHPDIQEEVAEEVIALWPQGEPLTMQALNDMKVLERVIKETLRLYPSVPFINRELQNDVQFGKYLVPTGVVVSVSKASLHRDPKVFPDPEKFDPDRFLPENIQSRHPYAYVPFSAGPRNCIGQKFAILEEKSVLAAFVRAFKFEAVDEERDIVVLAELIQRPQNGIKIKISKRIKS